jgi:hypothetical protein
MNRPWGGIKPRHTPTHVILRCKCGAAYQAEFEHRHQIRVRKRCACGTRLLGVKWGDKWAQV